MACSCLCHLPDKSLRFNCTSIPRKEPAMTDDPKTLVSTDWLAAHLKDPDLRVIDASWYLPDAGRDARAEYNAAHGPGAREIHQPHARDGHRRRASGGGL